MGRLPLPYMQYKKRYGQHFLRDTSQAARIAKALVGWGSEYQTLIEIGPGAGMLTQHLAARVPTGGKLCLIEIDRDLVPALQATYQPKGIKVVEADFIKWPLHEVGQEVGICGNFPYNVSSQIIFKILENRHLVPELVGMFQREVALRIATPLGGRDCGILSVLVQAYYRVETMFHLAPGSFVPPPKVHSSVIRLVRYRSEVPGLDAPWLFTVVKTAFQQRRKTLRNALAVLLQHKESHSWPSDILGKRAEQLLLEDFVDLAIWLKA